MDIKELGNRVSQIYVYTILMGTFIGSMGIGLFSLNLGFFVMAFVFGAFVTSICSLPNIFLLVFGLRYIYKHSESEQQKNNYFYYLWMLLSSVPILLFLFFVVGGFMSLSNLLSVKMLLPTPYIFASLYYIFKVNNKYDKRYPPNFKPNSLEDILDMDLD